jgi:recombinational DNA repair protein (RecF pathway)
MPESTVLHCTRCHRPFQVAGVPVKAEQVCPRCLVEAQSREGAAHVARGIQAAVSGALPVPEAVREELRGLNIGSAEDVLRVLNKGVIKDDDG